MNTNDTLTVAVSEPPAKHGLFSIEPGLAIWTWVVFGLLLIVLRRYAWKPMMESVKAREKMLADAVENARRTKEELENIARRQEEIIRQAEERAKEIVDSGRAKAEEAAAAIVQRARAEAEKHIEMAREQISIEKERAVADLKNKAVDMIIKTSEKLVETSLDEEKHRSNVRRWLERL